MPKISIIAAIQKKDRGIGLENDLLFRISDDLMRFKQLTSGHPIIMGRKTFQSIGNRPLPNRTNIVITRDPAYKSENILAFTSIKEALSEAKKLSDKIFIIGGGEIYRQTISLANRLYLTIVDGDLPADTFFPPYDNFNKVINNEGRFDEKNGLHYTFTILEK